jgi:hypothetical protein
MTLSVTDVLPYVQIGAGIAAGLGFFLTFLTFRRIGTTEQVKLVEKIKDTLYDLDKELPTIEDDDEDALSLWDSRLFNTLEWYSFLVNKKKITDKSIKEYFKDVIINHYEEHFLEKASEQEKNDADQY